MIAAAERRPRAALAAVFVAVVAVYLATASWTVAQTNDTRAASVSAWSVGTHGTFELDFHDVPWPAYGPQRRLYTDRFPGVVLWGAPFYAAKAVVAPAADPVDALRLDYRPGAVAAAAAAALAAAAVFAMLRRLHGVRFALAGTALFAFGTATWAVSADSLWSHGPAQLALAGALLAMASSRWGWAGVGFAAAAFTRPHLVVVGAFAAVWMLLAAWPATSTTGDQRREEVRAAWRQALPLAIGALAGLAAVSLYTHELFGTWSPIAGYKTGYIGTQAASGSYAGPLKLPLNVLRTLLDPSRGVLVYSPFLLALLPGVWAAWRKAPDWQRAAAAGGLAYLGLSLLLLRFSGGEGFFAYRVPLEALTLCVPILAGGWVQWTGRARWWRRALAVLAAVSFAVQGVGAVWLSIPRDHYELWDQRVANAEERDRLYGPR